MTLPLAIVTGGARGMGFATARRLAAEGFAVRLIDRDAAALASAQALQAEGLDVEAHVLELTDEPGLRAWVDAQPPVQAVVNNAGLFDERAFEAVTSDDFRRVYEVNLVALATLTQAVARRMPAQVGRIVHIASRAALGARNHPHYVASKAAVIGYTRACAMELAPRGILVNAVAPGLIDTPLLRALSPERLAQQLALQPTGEAAQPEDIAHAVAFFASPKLRFVTGQVLYADGGKSLGGTVA